MPRSLSEGVRSARDVAAQTRWRGSAFHIARAVGCTPAPEIESYCTWLPSVTTMRFANNSISSWTNAVNRDELLSFGVIERPTWPIKVSSMSR